MTKIFADSVETQNEELHRLKAELNAQRASYQSVLEYAENIVETVRESLVVLDSDLKILSANSSFYKTFNAIPHETIGKFIYELGNRQWDIPALRLLLEEILPTNTIFNDYEVEHVFQNIGRKIILLNARQIFRKDVGSHIILLAMQDITERKLESLALEERSKELNCLFSIITMLNVPGISLEEVFMKTVMRIPSAFQFPEITEACIIIEGRSFHTERFRETPWMLVSDISMQGNPIGQLKVCYLEERRIYDEGPFLIQEQHLLNAIAEKLGLNSEHKCAEIELHKLARAIDQSPVSITITDIQGTIESVNRSFTTMTGYITEEAIGQNHRILQSGKTPPETYEKLWSAITAGKTWDGEFINKRKDGSLFYEHAIISVIRDDKGAISHYLAVKEDITEKKSIMEQLIHSQKMESIGELAGGLAHDLNNILSVVNGYATLAKLEMDKNHQQSDYIQEILRASSRAASLTQSLLAYSRKQEMNRQNQDLNLLVETVGSFISRIIHDNITFTFSAATDPLIVCVDTVQIEQVLLNLATNARDAMPNGGSFAISIAEESIDEHFIATHGYGTIGHYAAITVTDNGLGMDEPTKHKVFDPFFTTKEVGKGTGLGLSMVMGIILQHGGFINLQSEPGSGSVFQIYLPLMVAEEFVHTTKRQDAPMKKACGTILLAEDDELTRTMMEELLTRAGYTVIIAVDGQDAVEKFTARKEEIQLVFTDIVMPRKSGTEARDEIRQMSASVKFIFASGHSKDVIEREGALGPDAEIITKPIMPFELLNKIASLICLPCWKSG
jgi:PAS domain S-box-containing protein